MLTDAEEARLSAIHALLGDAPLLWLRHDQPRTHPVLPLRVQISADGAFRTARLVELSGDGVTINSAHAWPLGMQTIVSLCALGTTVEFLFPAQVVWYQRRGATVNTALVFSGMPSQTRSAPPAHVPGTSWLRLKPVSNAVH